LPAPSSTTADFIVVGSGIAGLTFALTASRRGRVLVLTKKDDAESATNMAQGGIAAVVEGPDSFEQHIRDTLTAGVGLCHRQAVEIAVRSAPGAVARLMAWGARFSTERSGDGTEHFSLGREGGHSARRIVHAADMTGEEIESSLLEAVEDSPNIEILEDHVAIDAVVPDAAGSRASSGLHVLDVDGGSVYTISAPVTVLATGGCGKVYLYTTNPDISSGDGVAIAYRAGVPVRNMEFIQFHPTCLYHPDVRSFLISEAVRGEGAVLRDLSGRRIMKGVHPREDLAPRDVVARAIDRTMKETGDKHVLLDISHEDPDKVRRRFPNIYSRLLDLEIDMTAEPVPVVPAAHYLCGGVAVDLEGRTCLPGIYAVGEVAHTGMHGANRLASNSLLEAVVFSERAARSAAEVVDDAAGSVASSVPEWGGPAPGPVPEGVLIDHSWDIVRRLMWDYVGIVRTERRLELAQRRMAAISSEIEEHVSSYPVSRDLLELRNISLVGRLIIASARKRLESRGLHTMEDHPERDDANYLHDTVLEGGVLS
jgi:L-aspartate oxidase